MEGTRILLPDFEEFFAIVEKIKATSLELANLELEIETAEADIIRRATRDGQFFVGGKMPSMEYLKNTFKITGFNGELCPLRKRVIELSVELDFLKKRYEILKIACDLWRTQSSNERLNLV